MNNGGITQTAARSLASDRGIALPDAMLQAPSVNMDMHQMATGRAREMLFDIPACCAQSLQAGVLYCTGRAPSVAASTTTARVARRVSDAFRGLRVAHA